MIQKIRLPRVVAPAILCLSLTLLGCGVAPTATSEVPSGQPTGAGEPDLPDGASDSPASAEGASTRPAQPGAWDPCAANSAEPFVRLAIGGGIAGVNQSVAVHCDGTIERDGQVVASDAPRAAALITQLRDSGVLDLQDETFEPAGQCNDCFEYQLELSGAGAKPRRWSAVETAMPEQLGEAIEAVRSVGGAQ